MIEAFTKKQILKLIDQNDLAKNLKQFYPCTNKINKVEETLKTLLVNQEFDEVNPIFISRCPARISLSKHADYINSHLLYFVDQRDTIVIGQKKPRENHSSKIILFNDSFSNRELILDELNVEKSDWSFYIAELIKELDLISSLKSFDLVLSISSTIPPAGGLSSSHALMLSTLSTLAYIFNLQDIISCLKNPTENKKTCLRIINLCQKIEQLRGFKSGLGDQSAQLFSKKNHFLSIKIQPDFKLSYIKIPDELAFITIPSFIKADKSTPEFSAANENIKIYQTINTLSKELGHNYLADILEDHSEAEVFEFLKKISDKKLRGLALYGLAECARVIELNKNFSCQNLGIHLNLSHQAERNYYFENDTWKEISEVDKLNYKFDWQDKLQNHYGYYHASTQVNDELQGLSLKHPGVYGSCISGAGLGGNNLIACKKSQAEEIKNFLLENYYQHHENFEKAKTLVQICSSSEGLSNLLAQT